METWPSPLQLLLPLLPKRLVLQSLQLLLLLRLLLLFPQWGTADAEIKDPSVENPELKGSAFSLV